MSRHFASSVTNRWHNTFSLGMVTVWYVLGMSVPCSPASYHLIRCLWLVILTRSTILSQFSNSANSSPALMTVLCANGLLSNWVFVNVFSNSLTLSTSVKCTLIRVSCSLVAGTDKSEQLYTIRGSLTEPFWLPTQLSSLYISTRTGSLAVRASLKSVRSTLKLALRKSITAMSLGWTAWRRTSFSMRRATLRTLGFSQALTILPSASGIWNHGIHYARLMRRMARWSAWRSSKSTRMEWCAWPWPRVKSPATVSTQVDKTTSPSSGIWKWLSKELKKCGGWRLRRWEARKTRQKSASLKLNLENVKRERKAKARRGRRGKSEELKT